MIINIDIKAPVNDAHDLWGLLLSFAYFLDGETLVENYAIRFNGENWIVKRYMGGGFWGAEREFTDLAFVATYIWENEGGIE